MTVPSTTFVANLETFLVGSEPSLAGVLHKVGLAQTPIPQGVDDSFFRLVMLGFATYDHHTHPDAWTEASARVEFIREWATWAFDAEIQAGIDDEAEPDFSGLLGVVQQFKAREIPFFSPYMVDYFESA